MTNTAFVGQVLNNTEVCIVCLFVCFCGLYVYLLNQLSGALCVVARTPSVCSTLITRTTFTHHTHPHNIHAHVHSHFILLSRELNPISSLSHSSQRRVLHSRSPMSVDTQVCNIHFAVRSLFARAGTYALYSHKQALNTQIFTQASKQSHLSLSVISPSLISLFSIQSLIYFIIFFSQSDSACLRLWTRLDRRASAAPIASFVDCMRREVLNFFLCTEPNHCRINSANN